MNENRIKADEELCEDELDQIVGACFDRGVELREKTRKLDSITPRAPKPERSSQS